MKTKFTNFINKNKFITFSFTFFLLFGITINVFATPPSSPYGAGDTLDPSCAPGDSNCYVSGVSFFNYGDNGTVTTDGYNTFVGINSGNNTTGSTATLATHSSRNTAFGYNTLNSLTTGANNASFGYSALKSVTSGLYNTAVGEGALEELTTSQENVAVGRHAMQKLISGTRNTAVGAGAMKFSETGNYNTALGYVALVFLTTGQANTAVGDNSLYANTTGSYNVAVGQGSMEKNVGGNYNIVIGNQSGKLSNSGSSLTSLDNSIFIGYDARANAVSESNQIVIGYQGRGLGSNTTVIGNSSTTLTHIKGNLALGSTSSSYTLHAGSSSVSGIVARFENSTGTCDINPTTTSLSCSSDETLKTNIESIEDSSLDIIRDLRPVTYNWLTQPNQDTIPGFIAQEVETLLPKLVNTDPNTNLKSLNYTLFTPYIVKSIQELDITLQGIESLDENSTFVSNLKNWLASTTNGINQIFTNRVVTKEFCTSYGRCLSESELDTLFDMVQSSQNIVNIDTTKDQQDDITTDEEATEEVQTEDANTSEEQEDVTEEDDTTEQTGAEETQEEDIETLN